MQPVPPFTKTTHLQGLPVSQLQGLPVSQLHRQDLHVSQLATRARRQNLHISQLVSDERVHDVRELFADGSFVAAVVDEVDDHVLAMLPALLHEVGLARQDVVGRRVDVYPGFVPNVRGLRPKEGDGASCLRERGVRLPDARDLHDIELHHDHEGY